MRIQAAIDRVSIERALEIGKELMGSVHIVEVGTSLIKDYGLDGSVGEMRRHFPEMKILADLKTCDEGAYEFRRAYEAGADIATVMGFSSDSTIEACAKAAGEMGREYMIDLLETGHDRVYALAEKFPEALYAIHLPSDLRGEGLLELVRRTSGELRGVRATAAAGGVQIRDLPVLHEANIEIAIIGGAITKAEDIRRAADLFAEAAAGLG